ncbi:MAG: type II toxin-antitoxin system RelE/ParE family toxin [Proteobacteria bacterium]|nr:type II toxin-antitoxin system RelE/ParE family toxin [Pseudomonadota bacterium]
MIKSYGNAATRKVHETGNPKGFKGLDGELAADRLDDLAAAKSIADISPLSSFHLHKLKGVRKKEWAINVNGPWRICFLPTPEGFANVNIEDYH